MTRVWVEPRSYSQDCHKNVAYTHLATLPTKDHADISVTLLVHVDISVLLLVKFNYGIDSAIFQVNELFRLLI